MSPLPCFVERRLGQTTLREECGVSGEPQTRLTANLCRVMTSYIWYELGDCHCELRLSGCCGQMSVLKLSSANALPDSTLIATVSAGRPLLKPGRVCSPSKPHCPYSSELRLSRPRKAMISPRFLHQDTSKLENSSQKLSCDKRSLHITDTVPTVSNPVWVTHTAN